MVKALLVSLLLSLSLQLGAQGLNQLPDHETFVHLPAYEQKKIIVGFMQFMVAMEDTSGRELKTSHKMLERKVFLEKLITSLKLIEGLILSSAHAQADTDPFQIYRLDYIKVMEKVAKQTGDTICIYGGWISTIKPGTHVCGHPRTAKITNYPKKPNTPGTILGTEDIVCNPLIFGFKNPADKTLLVAVATTSSVNSSLDCMQQSQGIKKDKNGDEVKDKYKDLRLQQLKDAYTSPSFKDSYNLMTKMIHQTCLCKDAPNHMDQKYLDRINPHRTCFSLLNQYKHLRDAGQCSTGIDELGLNVDSFKDVFEENLAKMKKDLDNLKIKPESKLTSEEQLKLKDLDASFKLLLSKDNEQKFCEAQPIGSLACKIVSCSDVKDKSASCIVSIDGSKNPTKTYTVPMVNGAGSVKSIPTGSLAAVAVACTLPQPVCKVGECKEGKCAITVDGAKFVDEKESSIDFGKDLSRSIKVIPNGLKAASIFSVTCAAPPKEPKCEVSTCAADKMTGERTCEFTVPGFAQKEPTLKSFKIAKDAKDNFVEVPLENGKSVKCEGKDAEKQSSCTLSIVENKDDKKKIDVSLVLTLLEGDVATTPKFDPEFAATTNDKKLEYKATIDLATIADGKKITASKFSTKFPDEVCYETFPKGDAKSTIELEDKKQPKNADGEVIIIITAKISISTKNLIVWTGDGKENKDKAPDIREVVESDKIQKVCASHKEIDGGKEICKEIDAAAAPAKATLSLSGNNRSNQNLDVKAAVTLAGEDFSAILSKGYTLVWYEKNKPELTVEEKAAKDKKDADRKEADKRVADKDKKKTEKKTGQGGDSNTEDPKDKPTTTTTTDNKDAKAVDGQVQSGTAITYSAPIGAAKYEICANLMKDGKVEANGCKTVPAYTAPVQQQLGPPPVPGAYRYRRW
jgi:hypothetical protein